MGITIKDCNFATKPIDISTLRTMEVVAEALNNNALALLALSEQFNNQPTSLLHVDCPPEQPKPKKKKAKKKT